mmetsp:Transcript_9269/g.20748  ORF Transcript_9269/g.20748 Transcript_9269/m.20748 type:complete len:1129 (-) Transcript_9269:100-3486(-)|eukprot:CAMPEP_0178377240 /NCGR_PEP_ID=MMETSP0689_2-20121128/3818_1 /TAXON_ID=160604 /ORGANISM="Amphidinium massartii, Strain CS-259" /LENGTH=1128 /DNA_ID=CAMNT_0019997291 /DNA_START=62 /DNA_END=3448 /DNA_ORIENTATION=+
MATRTINYPNAAKDFCSNQVITSHYTWWNFVPKNIFEQFHKPANCYFFFLMILQCLPEVTTTGGTPTIALPLFIVIAMNAMKDALEDWRRHNSDRAENERITGVLRDNSGVAADKKWKDVLVGDILLVKKDEFVPADLVLLTSSNESGQVYIETANLDGETNLKTKQAPEASLRMICKGETSSDIAIKSTSQVSATVECEPPNEFLYTFVGNMDMKGSGSQEKVPLDEGNVVLRGCKIKQVAWCIGMVVYTGKESKIMMNSKSAGGRKISHLEREIGRLTLFILLTQCVLCAIAALVSAIFDTADENADRRYLNLRDNSGEVKWNFVMVLIIRFFNFIILFSNFIPISLLVSVNIVKFIQVYFIYQDQSMIHEGMHAIPRTSDLNEEMGQIEYVFSDKTGTLTMNVMDFRKFCVDGVTYGEGVTEIRRNVLAKMGQKVVEPSKESSSRPSTKHVNLIDRKLEDILSAKSGQQYERVRTLMLHLAINHEVIPEDNEDGSLTYSASSPDEAALVYGARHFGFRLTARNVEGISVQLGDGAPIKVKILATLKFNSTRKRSSVIAQFEDPEAGGGMRSVLFTKGADSVLTPRLVKSQVDAPEFKKTMETLDTFAEDGLRTLCLAGKDLTDDELKSFLKKFEEASLSTTNRAEQLDEVAELIEQDMMLHGITGVEDRLQESVGDTIVSMTQAGIKVWMLTGDKTETAVNIGIATGLLEPTPGDRPMFTTADFESAQGEFETAACVSKLGRDAQRAKEAQAAGQMFEALVMDGKCLEVALLTENAANFAAICRVCRTVVCCRVSPKQKGAVVRLIKTTEKAITLAIGDGANDCNMIQSADVGIGIRGLEGLQAFNTSDYGITQFRFLQTLLLIHGRWFYRRVAILVNYTFYKNIVVVLPQYFLGSVSMFSGQKYYNDIMYQVYNVVHTMLPIVIFGILEQDVGRTLSVKYPELYKAGHNREYMRIKVSALWLLQGLWHAIIVFWVPYLTLSNGNITSSDGKANDIWLCGSVTYLLVVCVANFRLLLETYYLAWFVWFGLCFSGFFWFIMQAYLSGVTGGTMAPELIGTLTRMFSMPMVYLVGIASIGMALMPDIHTKAIMRLLWPSRLDVVHEKILSGEVQTDSPSKSNQETAK